MKSSRNNNGGTTRMRQEAAIEVSIHAMLGSGRKRGFGATRRTAAMLKFLVFFTGATVVLMPFLVSFLSTVTDYEVSTLESFLASSKISLPPPPLQNTRRHASTTTITGASSSLSYKHSLEDPPVDSPYTILHTITSRFMVGQAPNVTVSKQLEIQQARYRLFETFCWPTVKHQTSMNFYWIVLVDPGLDPTIIECMKDLLNSETHFPSKNAFLVLTNNTKWSSDGIGVQNATSYGVGLQPVAQEFNEGTLDILTGDTDYLLRALDIMSGSHNTAKQHIRTPKKIRASQKPLLVIETLLDADDGLNNGAVEWIQTKAIKRTKQHWEQKQQQQQEALAANQITKNVTALRQSSPTVLPSLNATWWFLCGTDHIEWHNREIFQLTEEQYTQTGITSGLVGLRKSPLFCTSAGFTRIGITTPQATITTAKRNNSSSYSHMVFPNDGYSNHALTFYFPECTTSNASVVANGNYSGCWHREFPEKAFVIKSRTITSDSMDHLNVGKMKDYRDIAWLNASDYPLLINNTEHLWGVLGDEFSIDRKKAWETSVYIFEKRRWIIRQNKNSRCSPGFPCFKTARRNLLRIERYWAKKVLKRNSKQKVDAANRDFTANETTPGNKKKIDIVKAAKKPKATEPDQKKTTAETVWERLIKAAAAEANRRESSEMDGTTTKAHAKAAKH